MEWDQIESKWAAMTRRIRNDLSSAKSDAIAKVHPRDAGSDGRLRNAPERQPSLGADQQSALSAQ